MLTKEAVQEDVKKDLEGTIKALESFGKTCTAAAELLRKTVGVSTANGSNLCAMKEIISLLNHEYVVGSRLRPYLNRAHQVLWKAAKATLDAERAEKEADLIAAAPALFLRKKSKKDAIAE